MPGLIRITTLAAGIIEVAADSVWRIAHSVPDDYGDLHTQVDYGGGQQLTDETAEALVADLRAAGVRMIKLGAPDQSAVYINAAQVTAVEAAADGVDAPSDISSFPSDRSMTGSADRRTQ